MSKHDYWVDCISQAAGECGLSLTLVQLECLAEAVEGAHDNIGQAFYTPSRNDDSEVKQLQRQLLIERNKEVCPECKGRGVIFSLGPAHSSRMMCGTCQGGGWVTP